MFSSNKTTQKFIILLSDGVPNHAVGVSIISGGWFGPTAEERQIVLTLKQNQLWNH